MKRVWLSCLDFLSTMIQVAILVPKKRFIGSWMTQSTKLLSTRYLRIFCSAPPRYMMPGKQTMAAVPLVASQLRQCMMKAMSAFDFGARTPAGEKRGSLISKPLASPSHLMELGGFETLASKGSSSSQSGSVRVLPKPILNWS